MGTFFLPVVPSGTTETTIQYADNEISLVKIEIFLSNRDWYEIQEKPFYQALMQYLDSLKIPENTQHRHEAPD